jgi:hypothetical protein
MGVVGLAASASLSGGGGSAAGGGSTAGSRAETMGAGVGGFGAGASWLDLSSHHKPARAASVIPPAMAKRVRAFFLMLSVSTGAFVSATRFSSLMGGCPSF